MRCNIRIKLKRIQDLFLKNMYIKSSKSRKKCYIVVSLIRWEKYVTIGSSICLGHAILKWLGRRFPYGFAGWYCFSPFKKFIGQVGHSLAGPLSDPVANRKTKYPFDNQINPMRYPGLRPIMISVIHTAQMPTGFTRYRYKTLLTTGNSDLRLSDLGGNPFVCQSH